MYMYKLGGGRLDVEEDLAVGAELALLQGEPRLDGVHVDAWEQRGGGGEGEVRG